jgi:hypothetical protein
MIDPSYDGVDPLASSNGGILKVSSWLAEQIAQCFHGATERLTPAQRTWLEALKPCPGVETCLWRPDDWPAIIERLQSRDRPGQCDISRHESAFIQNTCKIRS